MQYFRGQRGCLLLIVWLAVGVVCLPVLARAGTEAKMERATEKSVAAFNNGDYVGSAEIYHPAGYVLAHGQAAISSQPKIAEMLRRSARGGMQYDYMKKYNKQIWACGQYVYELYDYQVKVTLPNRAQPVYSDNRDLSIWEKAPDGQIAIRVDIWSNQVVTGRQASTIDPNSLATQFYNMQSYKPDSSQPPRLSASDIDTIKQLDRRFYQCIIEKDVDAILEFYADDFMLVGLGKANITSKAALRKDIEQGMVGTAGLAGALPWRLKDYPEVLYASGEGQMTFLVNIINWKCQRADGSIQEIPGKGVHVWQQNDAGDWKLLIDIYNTDVRINGL